MTYKPGDIVYQEFVTSVFSTGAAGNADSLPAGTVNRNGTDDGAVTVTVTNIATGRYKAVFTIPATYVPGDVLNLTIAATVSSVAGVGAIWHGKLGVGFVSQGTATSGGGQTLTLQTALGADNRGVGCLLVIVSGTGSGQAGFITAYGNSSRVATISHPWVTNPDSTSVYAIIATANAVLADSQGDIAFGSIQVSGLFSAGNFSISGQLTANNIVVNTTVGFGSLNVSGAVSFGSMTVVGAINAGATTLASLTSTGAFTINGVNLNTTLAALPADVDTELSGTHGAGSWESSAPGYSGTARAGSTSTTIVLALAASSQNSIYVGQNVTINSGLLSQETKSITAYDGATRVATVASAWVNTPTNATPYVISGLSLAPVFNTLQIEVVQG